MKSFKHFCEITLFWMVTLGMEWPDSDRKVNRNIYPDAATCDRMRLIDPKSGQLGPINHCLVEEP